MTLRHETIDIDSPTFRRLTGDDKILAQAIRMRLNTTPGTYFSDPEYGFNLDELTLEGATPLQIAHMGARLAQEVEKEKRVAAATVTPSASAIGASAEFAFIAEVTPADGPTFSLTIAVSELSVDVLLRGA